MDLGLSYDPNLTLAIPKTKDTQNPNCEVMNIEDAKLLAEQSKLERSTPAVSTLMDVAAIKSEKKHNLNENDQLMCIYMIEKYGDDYKKMAKDHKKLLSRYTCST